MSAPVAEGQVLAGKYRVERILGQGGMGVVVAATHEQLQQKVALKFLLPGAGHEATQRFLREARAAVRLKSEHVARVTDVGELDDGSPYMVMEYLEGDDLSRIVRKRGPLPIEEAVTYVLHACEAIAEAHALGIVHRDLKPANLFLTTAADGTQTVKVLDFGISKTPIADSAPGSEPAVGLTQTEMMLGSPLYMAPEQMRSAKTVDLRADIWSLGGVLYQLLTSTVPFNTTSLTELILMINSQDPTPPRTHRPDLPEELEAAILRCLRRPREERFASVGELAQALAPFAPVEEVARSVPRILRTLGMTSTSPMVVSGSLRSISSSAFPASTSAAEAVARAVQATGAPGASQPPGAIGPYAATSPSKPGSTAPHAMTGPTMPSAGIVPPGASPSVAPPAVARTAQDSDPGQSSPPEPMPNAGTAAGWTAAGASRPPKAGSSGGKVIALAAALLAVGGGAAFAVVQLGKPPAQAAPASPAAAEIVAPPPVAPAPPPSATAEVTPAPPATAPEPAPTASAAPSATAPEPVATARTTSRPAPSATPAKTAAAPPPTTTTTPAPAATPASTIDDPLKRIKLH